MLPKVTVSSSASSVSMSPSRSKRSRSTACTACQSIRSRRLWKLNGCVGIAGYGSACCTAVGSWSSTLAPGAAGAGAPSMAV
eukprot:scaffold406_cov391-Prasinococcus_capsulatus_cf.AAC.21